MKAPAFAVFSNWKKQTIVRLVLVWLGTCLLVSGLQAGQISWSSANDAVNLTSFGQPLDSSFRFELGVFRNGFVPDATNMSQWAANWSPAQRTSYVPQYRWFTEVFQVTNNTTPFLVNSNAYIWGFSGNSAKGEWILFRRSTWKWPAYDPFDPTISYWNAGEADQVILGSINSSGTPFLMKSAAITNIQPPATSWSQWLDSNLANNPLNGPYDDPDGDSIPNLLEFAYGTSPLVANAPVSNTVSVFSTTGQSYLQISIPRLRENTTNILVEVSSDLVTWNSGPSFKQVISDTATSLVVRDLQLIGGGNQRRFMRVKVSLPIP